MAIALILLATAACTKGPPPPTATVPSAAPREHGKDEEEAPPTAAVMPGPVFSTAVSGPVPLPAASTVTSPATTARHRQLLNLVAAESVDWRWVADTVNPHEIDVSLGELWLPEAARFLFGLPPEGWESTELLTHTIDFVKERLEARRIEAVHRAVLNQRTAHYSFSLAQLAPPDQGAARKWIEVGYYLREMYKLQQMPDANERLHVILTQGSTEERLLAQRNLLPICGRLNIDLFCDLLPTFPEPSANTVDTAHTLLQSYSTRVDALSSEAALGEGSALDVTVAGSPLYGLLLGRIDVEATERLQRFMRFFPEGTSVRVVEALLATGQWNADGGPALTISIPGKRVIIANHLREAFALTRATAAASLVDEQQQEIDIDAMTQNAAFQSLATIKVAQMANALTVDEVRRCYLTYVAELLRLSRTPTAHPEAVATLNALFDKKTLTLRGNRLAVNLVQLPDAISALPDGTTRGRLAEPLRSIVAQVDAAGVPLTIAASYNID